MATLFVSIERANGDSIRFFSANRGDANGHRRIIVHYLDFLNVEDYGEHHGIQFSYGADEIDYRYKLASIRAKRAGFRKFNTKEFGGGFICQYDFCHCKDIAQRIENAIKAVPFESAL